MRNKWWPLAASVGVGTMTYMSMTRDSKNSSNNPVKNYRHYKNKGPNDTRNAN
ncbi:hypothetical protein QR721_09285 [Aciduricibacillus chroicocephali]|uniref:DUF3918 domain-containing protein n=1 Tax=Aciduricibacillus chroicocephali TaxID=3054939 RepID=A0ABY9KSN0_9BACI|nr:hypothetical protein QR721_09285 [Bacillaceae bacterium 44XB]